MEREANKEIKLNKINRELDKNKALLEILLIIEDFKDDLK